MGALFCSRSEKVSFFSCTLVMLWTIFSFFCFAFCECVCVLSLKGEYYKKIQKEGLILLFTAEEELWKNHTYYIPLLFKSLAV